MEIGRTIYKRRKELKLSQENLAELVGVSRGTISSWENDKKFPSGENFERLSTELKLSVDQLVSGEYDSHAIAQQTETESAICMLSWKTQLLEIMALCLLILAFAIHALFGDTISSYISPPFYIAALFLTFQIVKLIPTKNLPDSHEINNMLFRAMRLGVLCLFVSLLNTIYSA